MTIQNVRIRGTMLGPEDHGIMTFMLDLEAPGFGIGYGGYALDHRDRGSDTCVPNSGGWGYQAIRGLLEAVGVASWERLSGTLCLVEFDDGPGSSGRVLRIGHIVEDRWFDLAKYMEERK